MNNAWHITAASIDKILSMGDFFYLLYEGLHRQPCINCGIFGADIRPQYMKTNFNSKPQGKVLKVSYKRSVSWCVFPSFKIQWKFKYLGI